MSLCTWNGNSVLYRMILHTLWCNQWRAKVNSGRKVPAVSTDENLSYHYFHSLWKFQFRRHFHKQLHEQLHSKDTSEAAETSLTILTLLQNTNILSMLFLTTQIYLCFLPVLSRWVDVLQNSNQYCWYYFFNYLIQFLIKHCPQSTFTCKLQALPTCTPYHFRMPWFSLLSCVYSPLSDC